MSILRSLFGPSKEEIWSRLARELGGSFEGGGWLGTDVLRIREGDWVITLDTYTVSTGKSSTTYTRMRAPYCNADGFRFCIYRKSVFSGIGKMFGMQDIDVGNKAFDDPFIIQGNDPERVRYFFSALSIQELLLAQPSVHFEIRDDEGWFGHDFPDGVDELYFRALGVIRDLDRLRRLYDLFSGSLQRLCHMGSAYEDDPEVVL